MLVQYIVSLGATDLQKSKTKSFKAINPLQVTTIRVHLLVESFCIFFQKYVLQQGSRLGLVVNLLLIFHQTSGSCPYKIVLINKSFLI